MNTVRIPSLYINSGRKTMEQYEEAAKAIQCEPLARQKKDAEWNFPVLFFFNKASEYAHCSACKADLKLKDMNIRHNAKFTCPNCKREGKAVNIRLFKDGKRFDFIGFSEFWRRGRKRGTFCVPFSRYDQELRIQSGKVKQRNTVSCQTVLVIDGQNRFRFESSTNGWMVSDHVDRYFIPRGMWGGFLNSVTFYGNNPVSLKDVKGSEFEYSYKALKKAKLNCSPISMCHMTPVIEKLISSGYNRIAKELLQEHINQTFGTNSYGYYTSSHQRKTHDTLVNRSKIHQILGIPKMVLDKLSPKEKAELDLSFSDKYKIIKDYGLSERLLSQSLFSLRNNIERLQREHLNVKKAMGLYPDRIPEYLDYIQALREVGDYPDEKNYLYPEPDEMMRLHDEMIAKRNRARMERIKQEKKERMLRERKKEAMIREYAEELRVFEFSDEKYLIRPLLSKQEMVKESKAMHNCIRTYDDKYAERRSSLFTIRRKSNPGKPICSVEIQNKGDGWFVAQSRIKCNADPDEELKAFVETWMQTVAKYCNKHKRASKKLYRAVA